MKQKQTAHNTAALQAKNNEFTLGFPGEGPLFVATNNIIGTRRPLETPRRRHGASQASTRRRRHITSQEKKVDSGQRWTVRPTRPTPASFLLVATYNINGSRGSLAAVLAQAKQAKIDILLLQELHFYEDGDHGRVGTLADRQGLERRQSPECCAGGRGRFCVRPWVARIGARLPRGARLIEPVAGALRDEVRAPHPGGDASARGRHPCKQLLPVQGCEEEHQATGTAHA
eukprot:scaffold24851_cov146-Isochrysis_galbana.AAC.2